MKKIIATVIVVLLLLTVIGLSIYDYVTTGTFDRENIIRTLLVVVSAVIAIAKINIRGGRNGKSLAYYEKSYQEYIKNAFSNNKTCKRKLLNAIRLYNEDKMNAAIKQIESLKPKCISRQDFSAVYFFSGLFHSDIHAYEQSIRDYTVAVSKDNFNHSAYNNMGMNYSKIGRSEDAVECYKQAISIKPDYAEAYNNLAIIYREIGEYDEAIENGMLALKYNSKMYQSASLLSIVYKIKGDDENSRKYYNMAVGIGQNAKSLTDALNNLETE